jgi:hypothetical protein
MDGEMGTPPIMAPFQVGGVPPATGDRYRKWRAAGVIFSATMMPRM